jgi:hypothetical protein
MVVDWFERSDGWVLHAGAFSAREMLMATGALLASAGAAHAAPTRAEVGSCSTFPIRRIQRKTLGVWCNCTWESVKKGDVVRTLDEPDLEVVAATDYNEEIGGLAVTLRRAQAHIYPTGRGPA